jgi:hypothetical protein
MGWGGRGFFSARVELRPSPCVVADGLHVSHAGRASLANHRVRGLPWNAFAPGDEKGLVFYFARAAFSVLEFHKQRRSTDILDTR